MYLVARRVWDCVGWEEVLTTIDGWVIGFCCRLVQSCQFGLPPPHLTSPVNRFCGWVSDAKLYSYTNCLIVERRVCLYHAAYSVITYQIDGLGCVRLGFFYPFTQQYYILINNIFTILECTFCLHFCVSVFKLHLNSNTEYYNNHVLKCIFVLIAPNNLPYSNRIPDSRTQRYFEGYSLRL